MAKVSKTIEEWRAQLTPAQFDITRNKVTEKAFTGDYWDAKVAGIYSCVCCDNKVFDAKFQYDAGTGWASFSEPVAASAIITREDRSLFMARTEIMCADCEAHLGHVFVDGPNPGGQRFSLNSVSLRFKPAVDAKAT